MCFSLEKNKHLKNTTKKHITIISQIDVNSNRLTVWKERHALSNDLRNTFYFAFYRAVHRLLFFYKQQGLFYMYHPTDSIPCTRTFVALTGMRN